jgi:hypothetical protein
MIVEKLDDLWTHLSNELSGGLGAQDMKIADLETANSDLRLQYQSLRNTVDKPNPQPRLPHCPILETSRSTASPTIERSSAAIGLILKIWNLEV